MKLIDPESILLVALNCGLPPHAESLTCDDLRGPRSLFGESSRMPKPIGNWSPIFDCSFVSSARSEAYENSIMLWAGPSEGAVVSRAKQIADNKSDTGLDMPADTYLAGKSTTSFALAWDLLEDGLLPEWGSVICSCQSEGRGQLRRHWHSPRGNLYVTFRLPHDILLQGDAASLITGYLLLSGFKALGYPLSLKWPNDLLLYEQSKVGGILVEEKNGVLLAGLGVNLSEAPSAMFLREHGVGKAAVLLPEHSSELCSEIAGLASDEPLAPFVLWRRLVSEVILAYSRAVQGRGLPEVLDAMDSVLAWKEREVILMEGDEAMLQGHFLGLGPGGGLLLRLGHGERREFFSGSLSLVK